ncbi:A disintegrin and metalloproteinase with thrombospondin motifs 6-like [Saccoglossus kowalevskii]|uniref:A disintegrin and metalloproteinase with thrombospondin motifs 7-like n=1 Tax=Saccoglossus kowalevskii TaxID=10224 RepID=A0ABM0LUV6_SACKO|nr:PREDICTED: A disintegrin and metalloproteinase with thrombospondin motifs 7-like [Saccoglossus kowalevskii]
MIRLLLSGLLVLLTENLRYAASVPINFKFPHIQQDAFARSLSNYEVVLPQVVGRDGRFLSHDLSYHHRRLRTRSLGGDDVSDAYYKVSVGGNEYHLNLKRNDKFLGPGLVIERKRSNISESELRRNEQNQCHYHGTVKSRALSKVAISDCDGLKGFIHDGEEVYFIEPVIGHEGPAEEGHPHLVYKRSDQENSYDYSQPQNTHHHREEESRYCSVESDKDTSSTYMKKPRKQKRSVSIERNIEALVVVDQSMTNYYHEQRQDVETFVLTIMNMVSGLYHDASLGNAVNVVMVRLMFLEEDEDGLNITHHADKTLKSFCKWQNTINPPEESHPNHHDVAILMTRVNICANMNKPCGTLGLAEVTALCQPHRSCNVNEDTGLALAFTVAHELGHNLGMQHDGTDNECKGHGKRPHVMSPLLSQEPGPLVWSDCSRQYITRFLDRGWGECLNDEPSDHDFSYPTIPPGVMYEVNHQCQLQHVHSLLWGSFLEISAIFRCAPSMDLCDTLWCMVGNKCHSRLEAAAQGTSCGKHNEHRWCFAGACVEMEDPTGAINGNWGKWSEYSSCSRTCGGGISFSERHCDNPEPQYGGSYCVGERKRYHICNMEPCPVEAESFRAWQCSQFNSKPFQGNLYEWVPVFREDKPCELHCKPKNGFFSTKLMETVLDGTPCSYESRDMCIYGICMEVGCDYKIRSTAKEDRCGVCHGDGSTCKKVQAEFNKPSGLGYVEATVIPAGARNIRVEEVAAANNYLALKDDSGEYYLNGHWFIQWSGEYKAAGTIVWYERTGNKEKFSAAGPTKQPLHIMLLFQTENPGITFEYTIPKDENETEPRKLQFSWEYGDWTHCTKTCGGGSQVSDAVCTEKSAGIVDDQYCNSTTRPRKKQMSCNVQDCPPSWWNGAWQHCSVTCGNNGTRQRSVICVRSISNDEQVALSDETCKVLGLEKPHDSEPCETHVPCPEDAIWLTDQWSNCSSKCGEGVQTRTVKCKVAEQYCALSDKPETEMHCFVDCLPITNNTVETDNIETLKKLNNVEIFRNNYNQNGSLRHGFKYTYEDVLLGDDGGAKQQPDPNNYDDYEHESDPLLDGISFGEYEKFLREGQSLDEWIARRAESEKDSENDKKSDAILDYYDGIAVDEQTLFNKKTENEVLKEPVIKVSVAKKMYRKEKNAHIKENTNSTSRNQTTTTPTSEHLQTETITSTHIPDRTVEYVTKINTEHAWTSSSTIQTSTTVSHTTHLEVGEWVTGNWSECSVSCGKGSRHRDVNCSIPHRCDHSMKPERHSHCMLGECAEWVSGSWSQCSVTCGKGYQSRSVECVDLSLDEPATGCDVDSEPASRQTCTLSDCPAQNSEFFKCNGDNLNSRLCSVMKNIGRCNNPNYRAQCCATCQR